MSKRVRVAVEVSEPFVKMLQAKCQMKGWLGEASPELDVGGVLLVALLGEMRGAHEHEIHLMVPNKWRQDIEVAHALRRVTTGEPAPPVDPEVAALVGNLKHHLSKSNMRYVIEELLAELA